MNTFLKIESNTKNEYKFIVTIENNTDSIVSIPFKKLQNSAERVGLNFILKENRLDPVGMSIFKLKEESNIELMPDETVSMTMPAHIKKQGTSTYLLVFETATFVIKPNEIYNIKFSLNGYTSQVIKMQFDSFD